MKIKWNYKQVYSATEGNKIGIIDVDFQRRARSYELLYCLLMMTALGAIAYNLITAIYIFTILPSFQSSCSDILNTRRDLYTQYVQSHTLNQHCDLQCLKDYSELFNNFSSIKCSYYIKDYSIKKVTPPVSTHNAPMCDDIPLEQRYDCHPEPNASEMNCTARGCCWREISQDEVNGIKSKRKIRSKSLPGHLNLPYCFYPKNYNGYSVTNKSESDKAIEVSLARETNSPYPEDVMVLQMKFMYETPERLRIKIYDPSNKRWEPPLPEVPKYDVITSDSNKMYSVKICDKDASFQVLRNSSDQPIFDTRGAPLTFANQFLQISTTLTSDYVYGLGQHLEGLVLDTLWHQRVLWNLDQYNLPGRNLYGSHPFFLNMEQDGNAHGFLLLNSNALDAVLQPTPAVTFHVTGGILDMYLFLGPTPDDVIKQYTDVIGKPTLPPYWSLGYHQCRFGYGSVNRTREIWKQTRDAGIPFDVQWNDIDYMKSNNDFTYNDISYGGLPEFVDQVHEVGMHYIPIIDPGISASEPAGTYPPFDEGVEKGIFIRNESGLPFIGKVWNAATTAWPDFTHPNSIYWWTMQFQTFHDQVKFDGAWIDMNEPSNFWSGQKDGCIMSSLDDPPYLPPVHGGRLCYHTVCMNAMHHIGSHYNIHNLYSFTETIATNVALKMVTKKRPFIISRASFPGQGKFGGHWTGDVVSDWNNLWLSISDILNFNMFGIPMVGADICGFNGNTTASLCLRWMQLGAFYPFSRNHNTDDAIDQDPVSLGEQVTTAARQALEQRYILLPYLYSLFFRASITGLPVARPLFFQFPLDEETYTIDTQFMWGEGLMIVPALEDNAFNVSVYLPYGIWYDWYTGDQIGSIKSQYEVLDTPIDSIRLLLLGGHILPLKPVANTTTQSRLLDFELIVALDEWNKASGFLFWDDGDSLDAYNSWIFSSIDFTCEHNSLYNTVRRSRYSKGNMNLGSVKIYGVVDNVHKVIVNKSGTSNFEYSSNNNLLRIWGLKLPLYNNFNIQWL